MSVSRQKLNSTINNQLENIFFQLVSDTTSIEQAQTIFTNLLTKSELLTIIQRLAIAIYLDKGRSYENIKSNLKVNKEIITNVQAKMGDPGIQLALQKIKSEAWADSWVQRIESLIKKLSPANH